MSKLEEVRAKVIEAVPEIAELKPGCQVSLYGGELEGVVVSEIGICKRHKTYKGCQNYAGYDNDQCGDISGVHIAEVRDDGYSTYDIETAKIKPYEVRGRPITLADVLRAIRSGVKTNEHVELFVGINAVEMSFIRGTYDGEGDETSFVKWNLALPLDEQEPEVIEFLHKILCHD